MTKLHDNVDIRISPEAIIMFDQIGTLFFDHSLGELSHDSDLVT